LSGAGNARARKDERVQRRAQPALSQRVAAMSGINPEAAQAAPHQDLSPRRPSRLGLRPTRHALAAWPKGEISMSRGTISTTHPYSASTPSLISPPLLIRCAAGAFRHASDSFAVSEILERPMNSTFAARNSAQPILQTIRSGFLTKRIISTVPHNIWH
jgi:hypothetical protein